MASIEYLPVLQLVILKKQQIGNSATKYSLVQRLLLIMKYQC